MLLKKSLLFLTFALALTIPAWAQDAAGNVAVNDASAANGGEKAEHMAKHAKRMEHKKAQKARHEARIKARHAHRAAHKAAHGAAEAKPEAVNTNQ